MQVLKGFSLVELLIVVVIIGILSAIAYPVYTNYITEARRSEGKAALLNLSAQMERYFSTNNTYATATIATGGSTDVLTSDKTENGWYQLEITAKGPSTFTITAKPLNEQASQDSTCGSLSLTNLGAKGVTGSGTVQDCWG